MELAPGTVIADRFVVEALLGRGGMALVYRVRHRALGTTAALKVLAITSAHAVSRLVDEGRHQGRLRHPNVLAVLDLLDVRGAPGLVLELVEGPPLSALLGGTPLAVGAIDRLGEGILAGVAAAHRHGLVHRDLKPGNVLLATVEGEVVAKVADFGIARALGDDPDARRTVTGAALGTPQYMAPEQVRDAKDVDARADVWALGALLYELAAGVPPFDRDDRLELFQAIANGTCRPLAELRPDLPPRMIATVEAALQVDRATRPPDAGALLDRWLAGREAVEDDGGALAARVAGLSAPPVSPSSSGSGETWSAETTAPLTAAPPSPSMAPTAPGSPPPRSSALPLVGGGAMLVLLGLALVAVAAFVGREPAGPPGGAPFEGAAGLVVSAREALLDTRFDDAARDARTATPAAGDVEALRIFAVASWAMGHRYAALEELAKGLDAETGADGVRAMLDGLIDPEALDAWLEAHPDDVVGRTWRSLVAATWDPAAVRANGLALAALVPDRALPAWIDARTARLEGREAEAEAAQTRWRERAPDNLDERLEVARYSASRRRAHDAIAVLDALVQHAARRPDLWALRVGPDLALSRGDAVATDRVEGSRLTLDGRVRFHVALADARFAARDPGEGWAELAAADLVCRGDRDPLVLWMRGEVAQEVVRLGVVARDQARVSDGVAILREVAGHRHPEWVGKAPEWRLKVGQALLALVTGDRPAALRDLDLLRTASVPEWMVRPLADALGTGAPLPLRVRPDLLP